jgi:hypothetical protein
MPTVMQPTRIFANALLLVVSLGSGLLISEIGARLVLNPADYLSVNTVADDVLGIRVLPGTAGFDEWGFRNSGVPSKADVVAVGDSHTYGTNAPMADAWPAVVAGETGLGVYNLGLGGYGPNQYYEVLRTRALKLQPKWVVCAIYMGDDFENAFLMTYGKEHWASLRAGGWKADANIWEAPPTGTLSQRLRLWLSQHSVVYRVVVHGPVLGSLKGAIQIGRAAGASDPATTTLVDDKAGIQEAFRPASINSRVNPHSPQVREGMRITFELLRRMNDLSREHGAQFVVVVIPTKETVFAEYLLRDPATPLRDVVDDLVNNERSATDELIGFLDGAGIPHVQALSALRRRVSEHLYTRSDRDMHPGSKGYHVIGEVVAEFLRNRSNPGIVTRQAAQGATGRPAP